MFSKPVRAVLFVLAALCSTTSYADSSIPLKSNSFGYFTTLNGEVVFTCNKDVPKSTTRNCHVDSDPGWTPLLANDADKPGGLFGIAKLDDGQLHWTYRGKPIYIAAPVAGKKSPYKMAGHKALWREH
ncbi:MAG: hypothetical protein ABSF50_06330 [Burkholderiaceae bacterium]|jgi:predicted lipoprotein with Yx(FWY)xxD motif